MGNRKLSLTTRYVLLVGILLLVANSVLGVFSLRQSISSMRTLIEKDMLDIVNSAAASLDGDALGALTAEDADGPVFAQIKRQLLVFQNSTDIEFIYAVKRVDVDRCVFTVDPDPEDPGEFGEDVVTTPAMISAAEGVAAVDSESAADRWGNFYSAFSPVFDSDGNVIGVVGVDFNTQWYEDQIRQGMLETVLITVASVVVAGIVVWLITHRVRIKFQELDANLSALSGDVDVLMQQMTARPGFKASHDQPEPSVQTNASDELEALEGKIRSMQNEMLLYLDYLSEQAYVDALTQVNNSAAYHEEIDALNKQIGEGSTGFCVAVFDINSLKELNDTHGHACGDYYIMGTAAALANSFGEKHVYRIGGDEFSVILEGAGPEALKQGLSDADAAIAAFNASSSYPATLAISVGADFFDAEHDTSFEEVFARADHQMYQRKREYYQSNGYDRRHAE